MSKEQKEKPKKRVCDGCGIAKTEDEIRNKGYLCCCPDGFYSNLTYNQGLADYEEYLRQKIDVGEIKRIINKNVLSVRSEPRFVEVDRENLALSIAEYINKGGGK